MMFYSRVKNSKFINPKIIFNIRRNNNISYSTQRSPEMPMMISIMSFIIKLFFMLIFIDWASIQKFWAMFEFRK
jgi:phosphomevalonate kinase